ncbi:hypothetical protein J437_LFUL001712 [Ladona fulva]|uniref:Sema domain-containing protein n=1 Tax=Ladona fulva TaxID=123851 RepID=A0A8K0NV27_LADFU|nr:hypothetical protein J437_LFUL001712 [Ladona fulva]
MVSSHKGCIAHEKLQTIAEDFCGLDVNTPLGGEQPIPAVPVLVFNTHLTAVAATSTGDYTVVFVGTANGHLKKNFSSESLIRPEKPIHAGAVPVNSATRVIRPG